MRQDNTFSRGRWSFSERIKSCLHQPHGTSKMGRCQSYCMPFRERRGREQTITNKKCLEIHWDWKQCTYHETQSRASYTTSTHHWWAKASSAQAEQPHVYFRPSASQWVSTGQMKSPTLGLYNSMWFCVAEGHRHKEEDSKGIALVSCLVWVMLPYCKNQTKDHFPFVIHLHCIVAFKSSPWLRTAHPRHTREIRAALQ